MVVSNISIIFYLNRYFGKIEITLPNFSHILSEEWLFCQFFVKKSSRCQWLSMELVEWE